MKKVWESADWSDNWIQKDNSSIKKINNSNNIFLAMDLP